MTGQSGPGGIEHRFEVRLHDTDAAGVLFFGHLFRHAHDAYESLLAAIGLPLHALIAGAPDRPPLALPVIRAEADYRLPMGLGERVMVRVEVLELRRRSFALGYRFEDAQGRTLATARTVHCCHSDQALPPPLAQALRARLDGDPPQA
jgi:1,4-dihydroxy-2-naphthoyl-CoA hydrolase